MRARLSSTDRRRPLAAALLVLAAVALVYVPSALTSEFVYDDFRFIVDNPRVVRPRDLTDWISFLHDPRTTDPTSPSGIVRPLRTLEFALDHALFRLSPAAFRLHSLAWHALASVLSLALFRRLTGSLIAATVAALFFALHPMHVECVAFVSSRGDVAMGACVMAALVCLLGETRRSAAAALALSGIAMLYKETAVITPLLVFAVRLARPADGGAPGRVMPALRSAVPFFGVAALYLVFRGMVMVGDTAHLDTFVLGGSTAGTFSTMFRAMGAYLLFVAFPVAPALDWYLTPTADLAIPSALAWLTVHVLLVVTAVRWRARRPQISAAICLVYFPLIPVANWPFAIGIPTAERFLYLSTLGGALVVAWIVTRCGRAALPAAAVALISFGATSAARAPDWKNTESLMTTMLAHGTSPRAHAYYGARDREKGLALVRRSGRVTGEAARQLTAESRAAFESGRDHFHASLELWRRFEMVAPSRSFVVVQPHLNAASVCLYLKLPGEALWHSDRALFADESFYHQAHYTRALALLALGRPVPAVSSLERCVELGMPPTDRLFAWNCLRAGERCLELGATDAATRSFELARDGSADAAESGVQRASLAEPPVLRIEDSDVELLWDELRPASAAEVVSRLRAAPPGKRRDLLLAFALEEDGRDDEALPLLVAALADPTLAQAVRPRAEASVARIETGCPALRDQGPSSRD